MIRYIIIRRCKYLRASWQKKKWVKRLSEEHGGPCWLESRDGGESAGTGGWRDGQIRPCRPAEDFQLQTLWHETLSGELRADNLRVIYVLRDPCECHLKHELVGIEWGMHEWGKSGGYCSRSSKRWQWLTKVVKVCMLRMDIVMTYFKIRVC